MPIRLSEITPKKPIRLSEIAGPPTPPGFVNKNWFTEPLHQPSSFQGPPPPRPRLQEFQDATARGTANVGSGLSQGIAGFLNLPTPGSPYAPAMRKSNQQAIEKARSDAALLWKVAKDPSIASKNKDLASKALNLIGETIPYITATTAAFVSAGPMGAFAVGSLVEGNSAYRTALDDGVDPGKAKKIGIGVGIVSGAIESFGGKGTEMLLNKATAKLKSKAAKGAAVFGTGTIVEALEEAGQEVAAITGEETYRDVDWSERVDRTLSAAAGGAFLGGAMRGASMAGRGLSRPPVAPMTSQTDVAQLKPPVLGKQGAEISKGLPPIQEPDLLSKLSPPARARYEELQKKKAKKPVRLSDITPAKAEDEVDGLGRTAAQRRQQTQRVGLERSRPITEMSEDERIKIGVRPGQTEVVVYRGVGNVEGAVLERGDFVTPDKKAAKSIYGPNVIQDTVNVKDLRYFRGEQRIGNALTPVLELVYAPAKAEGEVVDRKKMGFKAGRLAIEEVGEKPLGINVTDAQERAWSKKYHAAKVRIYNKLVQAPTKAEGEVKQPWEKSDLATAPNIPIGNVKAEKQTGGKWKLMFRGTRNEVFQGELFNSASEARQFFKAQKLKAQNALGVDKENPFIDADTATKEMLLKQFYQEGVSPDIRSSYEKLKESFTKQEAEDFMPITGILDKQIAHAEKAPAKAEATPAPAKVAKPVTEGEPEWSGGQDPITLILRAAKETKALAPEVIEKQSKEKSKRVGKAAGMAKSKKGTAESAIGKSTGALKGELTEYRLFEPIRELLHPEVVDNAFRAIQEKFENGGLDYFGMLDTYDAFRKLIDGYALTLREAALIEKMFGKEMGKVARSHVPWGDKIWAILSEVVNIPRTMLASYDQSGILRQGRALGQINPSEFIEMAQNYHSAFWSNDAAERIEKEYMADPYYKEVTKDRHTGPKGKVQRNATGKGLEIVSWGTTMGEAFERSERFLAAGLLERIPVLGIGIRASERSFVTALNAFRMAIYSKIRTEQTKQGKKPTLQERLILAARINDLTGRSNIAKTKATKAMAPYLNALFSPRFSISRIKPVISLPTDVYRSMRDGKFREELKMNTGAMTSLIATNLAIMFLLKLADEDDKIEIDPDLRSANGGKVKIGDTRIDLWSGYLQPAQLFTRLAASLGGKDNRKSQNGQYYYMPVPKLLYQFGRSKANPVMGLVIDVASGSTFYGEPVGTPPKGAAGEVMTEMGVPKWVQGVSKETWNRMIPLVIQDTNDAYREEGIPMAVTAAILSFYGAGVQSYPPYERKGRTSRRRRSRPTYR